MEKRRKEAGHQHSFLSLLPDFRCKCDQPTHIPAVRPSHHDGLHPPVVGQSKPFSLKLFLLGILLQQ